ncbi:formylmethanofuran dehydrogenase subunit C [Planctomycetaceae bacterium SH139]
MSLQLTLKAQPSAPLNLTGVSVTRCCQGAALDLVRALPLDPAGAAKQGCIGDWFEVAGETSAASLVVAGDLRHCHQLAAHHQRGEFIIHGSVGECVAFEASGGHVLVEGSVGTHAASGMRGGRLTIAGNAGDYLGGPRRAVRTGMRGGTVVVAGSVGAYCGHRLRRGTVIVGGAAGAYCGWEMIAGTLAIGGPPGAYLGLAMRRGTILAAQAKAIPQRGFTPWLPAEAGALRLIGRALREELADAAMAAVAVTWQPLLDGLSQAVAGSWQRSVGDRAVGGLGELLVPCSPQPDGLR